MSEKVVLPKFDLPGQGPHPAIKALWIVGGLLAVAVLGLSGALWHHHSQQIAAVQEALEAKAAIAARAAEAIAATEAAKAKIAEAAAKAAAAKAGSKSNGKTAGAAVVATQGDTNAETGDKPAADHHHSSHHHASAHASHGGSSGSSGSSGSKAIAKSDSHANKSSAASNKKKDDAIDKLLASFK